MNSTKQVHLTLLQLWHCLQCGRKGWNARTINFIKPVVCQTTFLLFLLIILNLCITLSARLPKLGCVGMIKYFHCTIASASHSHSHLNALEYGDSYLWLGSRTPRWFLCPSWTLRCSTCFNRPTGRPMNKLSGCLQTDVFVDTIFPYNAQRIPSVCQVVQAENPKQTPPRTFIVLPNESQTIPHEIAPLGQTDEAREEFPVVDPK